MVLGSGFRALDLQGLRVQGLRVQGSRVGSQGFRLGFQFLRLGSGCRVAGLSVQDLGFNDGSCVLEFIS